MPIITKNFTKVMEKDYVLDSTMATPSIFTLQFFITALLFLLLLLLLRLYFTTRTTTTKNLPPSPPKLPIIGNLHQIGPIIHRSLYSLSQRYGGHLMLLHLGSAPTLVASSVESAREIMQTHDQKLASRAPMHVFKKLLYDSKEIAAAPYGEHWRQAKKIIVVHLLGNNRVKAFRGLMDQEIAVTVRNVEKHIVCNEAVNLGDLFFEHSNSILCMATFGRKYDVGEMGRKFKKVMKCLFEAFARFYFVDYFPRLAWVDQISGANHKLETVAKEIDEFLEVAIEDRLVKTDNNEVGDQGDEPFIDALLGIQKDGFSLDKDEVKALLLDSYLAGVDTISSLLEWVMAELLRHPSALNKLKAEVRAIVNGNQLITDNDVEQMKYLKVVILETTRLHSPAIPFNRVAMEDVTIMGFDTAKGTRVFINVWAIGRDPKVWDRPDEFVPERFLDGSVDFNMHDFKLLPFGAGRRNCPGRVFSLAVVENLLANLLCKFNWVLPDGVKNESIDMSETITLAIHKKTPLLAFATPSNSC